LNFEYYIAKKIAPGRTETYSKPVVRIAILSIALGLALILASIAIVIGFKHSISQKMLGFAAPLQVVPFDKNESLEESPLQIQASFLNVLKNNKKISHFQYAAQKAGVIKTTDQIQGIILKGLDTSYNWAFLKNNLVSGRLPNLRTTGKSREVLISKWLADKLLLKTGDALRIWFIGSNQTAAMGRKLTITGIYSTGIEAFDSRYVLGDLRQIQSLNGWNSHQVGSIEIQTYKPDQIEAVAQEVYQSIPYNLNIQTIFDQYPEIFNWLKLLDTNVVVILVLLMLVAGITMISTLFILIIERTQMVGILKTMGVNKLSLRKIFLYKASYIILWGMFLGNLLGVGFYLIQYHFHWLKLDAQNYYVSYVPVELHWTGLLMINVGVFVLSILMLLLPSRYLSRITPATAIRYE
jgi:lipoprotein-releasing system permease protein